MKHILISLLFCFTPLSADSTTTVRYHYDWNRDSIDDQFIFYPHQQTQNDITPADFVNFTIHLSGKGDFSFTDPDSGWVKFTNEACYAPVEFIKHNNLLTCEYAALLPVIIKHKQLSLLFVFSFSPANEPGYTDILNIDSIGKPVRIWSNKADLCNIADLNNDGYSEIVLAPQHEYCENYYKEYHYSTYAPYYVYTLTNDYRLSFNLKLTGLYNKKHYVGWVGLDSARNYIIWDNPKTKTRILTTLEEAKKRYFK